jgi:hypothetical protein
MVDKPNRFFDENEIPFEVVIENKGTKKFQEDYADFADAMVGEPLCYTCKHDNDDGTCAAYPEAIPLVILTGEVNHHLPYEGDNGIQYEPEE